MRYIAEDLATFMQWISLILMPVYLVFLVIKLYYALEKAKTLDPQIPSKFDTQELLIGGAALVLVIALFLISTAYKAILDVLDKTSKLLEAKEISDGKSDQP